MRTMDLIDFKGSWSFCQLDAWVLRQNLETSRSPPLYWAFRGVCRVCVNPEQVQKNHCDGKNGAVMWVGTSWSCRKRLRHYNSFQRNGINISVQDFVYVMSEKKEHHVGYIEDMYEDKKSRKKLHIRWFHKTNKLFCKIPPPTPHFREVFYTPFPQVLTVECVDGLATVLKPEHFEKCSLTLPHEAMADIHICSRQFDGECIKPFDICDLQGYWHQQVLKVLDLSLPSKSSPTYDLGSDDMEVDEDDEIEPENVVTRGPRTARYCRRRTLNTDSSIVRTVVDFACGAALDQSCLAAHCNTEILYGQRLEGSSSLAFGVESKKSLEQADQRYMQFDVGDKIEALSEDSGIRGCWFRGTVTRRVSRRVKIRYDDLLNEDGNGNLEEWVSACKAAALDKLGVRIAGRVTLRPSPNKIASPTVSEDGLAVDAWWHDGWWEGVVTKLLPGGEVQVYFPGESDMCSFQQRNLRISRDWVNCEWVDVKNNPHIILSTMDGFPVGNLDSVVERTSHPRDSPIFKSSMYPITVDPPGAHVDLREVRSVSHLDEVMKEESSAAELRLAGDYMDTALMSENEVSQSEGMTLQRSEMLTNIASSMGCSKALKLPEEARVQEEKFKIQTENSEHSLRKECGSDNCGCPRRYVEDLNVRQLKWKSGRKRQRQACSARMEKSRAQFLKGQVRESSAESIPEEDSCLQEDSGETKWQSIENFDNDLVKIIRGHEGTSPIHGTTGGNNVLLNSLPAANLVMSR